MNKLILCEGMTDAVLLSYYLDKVAGWKFCRKAPKEVAIFSKAISEIYRIYDVGKFNFHTGFPFSSIGVV